MKVHKSQLERDRDAALAAQAARKIAGVNPLTPFPHKVSPTRHIFSLDGLSRETTIVDSLCTDIAANKELKSDYLHCGLYHRYCLHKGPHNICSAPRGLFAFFQLGCHIVQAVAVMSATNQSNQSIHCCRVATPRRPARQHRQHLEGTASGACPCTRARLRKRRRRPPRTAPACPSAHRAPQSAGTLRQFVQNS